MKKEAEFLWPLTVKISKISSFERRSRANDISTIKIVPDVKLFLINSSTILVSLNILNGNLVEINYLSSGLILD